MQDIIPLIQLRKKRKSTLLLADEFLQECYGNLTSNHLSPAGHPAALYSTDYSSKGIQRSAVSGLIGKNYMGNELSYREKKLLGSRHPLTSLLAIIRKQGMDLLLPSVVQDKVLVTIFVAIHTQLGLAHKELIDMVIAVKEDKWQEELDQISKTKIRGVLTLLKHAESLSLQPAHLEAPVALGIAKDITCFEDLRNKHDRFLITIAAKENVPISDWRDIIWPENPDDRMRRIVTCKKYEKELITYFEERKVVLAEEQRQAELLALAISPESGKTSRDDWGASTASRDDWGASTASRDDWGASTASRDDWGASTASRDDWASNCSTETTPIKFNSTSLTTEAPIQPSSQHCVGQLLLPPIQNGNSATHSVHSKTMSLTFPQPYLSTQHYMQLRESQSYVQANQENKAQQRQSEAPSCYSLWAASKFIAPNTILHSGLRNNVDIIDQTLANMEGPPWFLDKMMLDDSILFASDISVGRFSTSPSTLSDYDMSPFDLVQAFGNN